MIYVPEMLIFILSAAIMLLLIAVTWQRRHLSSGHAFLLLMLCALIWTVTFTLEIASHSLELKVFFVKIQFISITFLPLAWLYLILSHIGHVRSRIEWALLAVIPVITNIIVWFVPRPNWFWKYPKLVSGSTSLPLVDYDYGFWFYYVHVPYSYTLIFTALTILVRTFFKSHSIYRYQIIIMIIAILLPVITDILYVFGYSPISYFNYTTAVFSVSCFIIAWSLFRFKFLDLLPMARYVVIENMDDGVIVLDVKDRIVDANPSAMAVTGISPQDIGRQIREISLGSITSILEEISSGNRTQIEIRMEDTGDIRVFDLRLSIIKDRIGQVQGSVVTLRDYTERSKLFNKLREQAIYDSLTGIFNRRHLIEIGQKEMDRIKRHPEKSVSIIMIDIDKFKAINDMYGHATGDKLLTFFVEHCKNCIRPYDAFGRMGGDEFVIILPDTKLEDAIIIAKRINKSIEQMCVSTTQGEISITVSLGVVSSQDLDSLEHGLERLFYLADEQMYRSKKQGRNQVAYI
ncbi:MAG: diguanylate cyclase [Firmicutes bacterium]|nr:diguanylate cyclase [Bacillota bacterium]